jgi:cytochrome c oxidase cbb3-type subunit I/II
MKSASAIAAGAGFFFVTLAMFVQGVLPSLIPESRTTRVSRAVRTELGDVKWVRYDATDYTALERLGRGVYIREGCWYCHSQYVRPVAGEDFRWGPVSEAGEYAYDQPHLFGTRRIGPDLTRIGGKYDDDWHYAHFWDPRMLQPESIMPSFPWLFEQVVVPVDVRDGVPALRATAGLRRYFTLRGERPIVLFPNADGVAFVRPPEAGAFPLDGVPVLDVRGGVPGLPPSASAPGVSALRLLVPTPELVGLVRYVQKLGMSRGAWREVFEPQNVAVAAMTLPASGDLVDRGRDAYGDHCAGCHGVRGDGNGPAATFLSPRPRDFTAAVFKFRSTPSGALPTDGDLFRTLTRGVRWTAMPPWHDLPERERLALVAYVKSLSPRWTEEPAEPVLVPGAPPRATPALLARGTTLYTSAKCWECHGESGRGDGPSAAQLKDDHDLPNRPTDFVRGRLKGGASVADVFRAITTGLDGTPMPSFADALPAEDRWALAYHVLSLSAWGDPLTGEKLTLSPAAKAALNGAPAGHPRAALDPLTLGDGVARTDGGRRKTRYPGITE